MQVVETPVAGEVRDYQMLIGGEWVDAQSGRTFESINPYTGKVWAVAPEAGEADVDAAVRAARTAFDEGPWGRMTGTERARLMRRLAALLDENAERLATIESTDNGKLIREMGGQLKSLSEWYYYFAGAADKLEGETIPSDKPNFFVYTRREPVGVVGAITPWNSPLLLLSFKLAPALAPPRRLQRRHGLWPWHGWATRAPSRGRQGGFHRVDCDRHPCDEGCRRSPGPCEPRAGWEVAQYRLRRRG